MRRATFVHRGEKGPEELSVELDGSSCTLRRGQTVVRAEVTPLPDGRLSLLLEDGRQICGRVLPADRGEVEVVTGGVSSRIAIADPLRDRLAHSGVEAAESEQDEEIRAQMPGRVVEVSVAPGDKVGPGGLLLVLEAMKMQNEIRTSRGGTVLRVQGEAGKAVEGGTLLAVLRSEKA